METPAHGGLFIITSRKLAGLTKALINLVICNNMGIKP
jgi:hypothetical protein